jgi:hypothetical protein
MDLAARDRGFSTLMLLGASALLVYVNRLRGAAILHEMNIIWWWYDPI